MKAQIRILLVLALMAACFTGRQEVQAQVFWLGVNGGATYSWFTSPKADDVLIGEGLGWNMGFFARYGKRPFYQVGFHWTRASTQMKYFLTEDQVIKGDVPFNNFDLALRAGYEIIRKPICKWHVNAGPCVGTSFLFSTNVFEIESNDMHNPQWGLVAGTGFQYMNSIVDLDYQYHLSELFDGDEVDLGVEFGSHLQHLTLKVGFIF